MKVLGKLALLIPVVLVLVPAISAPAERKLLFLTLSAGFKHPVVPLAEKIMPEIGKSLGGFQTTVTQDCGTISESNLKNYSAVMFYTTGELPVSEEGKKALLDFIKTGKGFVGVHSATDTFYKWPEYGEMIGGYFDGHPWNEEIGIKVDDTNHPATRHLGKSFRIHDEIYQHKNFSRDRVKVLMSMDTSATNMDKKGIKRTDGDFALAWVRDWGKGRVFHTALGHRPEVWSDV